MKNNSLQNFLCHRLTNHRKDFVFWIYFVLVICGIGAAGIWANFIPALITWDAEKIHIAQVASAIYTFFPVLIVGSCAEIILPDNVLKPVRMLAIALLIISPLWMILCATVISSVSILLGTIGCIVAVLCWIIAHGEDYILSDTSEHIDAPLGGSDTKNVSGSEGEFLI